MTKQLRKIATVLIAVTLLTTTVYAQQSNQQRTRHNQQQKVGLVLGGGGAKGVAHIGVLRVLERAGIPVDIITSTSMGSIIGGAYACGHSAEVLDSVVKSQVWSDLLSDREDLRHQSLKIREKQNIYFFSRAISFSKTTQDDDGVGGFIAGTNIAPLFDLLTTPYNDSIDFNTLPIPFACVATNVVDNSEYVFHSGRLPQAMRASMAIPGVFAPVRKDSMVLIDGGLRNNFPADIAREMGAKYIIGVDVQELPKGADKIHTGRQIISQISDWLFMNKYEENLAMTDIAIHVNTDGYSAASFSKSAIDTLIRRGEEAAMAHWDELIKLKKKLGLNDGEPLVTRGKNDSPLSTKITYKIASVIFENMSADDEEYLRKKFKLQRDDVINQELADIVCTSIRHDRYYKSATYRIQKHKGSNYATLILSAGPRRDTQINLGVRFDNEEMVALQANGELPIHTKMPMDLELTLRLGKRLKAQVDWTMHPLNFLQPTISYIFRNNDIGLYEYGDHIFNVTYNQHTVKLALFNFNIRNFNISIGANWDYYDYHSMLVNHQSSHTVLESDFKDKGYITYEGRIQYKSENHWLFPTNGICFQARFAYITDNFIKLDNKIGMRQNSAMFRANVPLSRHISFQPMFYGRTVRGSSIPVIFENLMGGEYFDHYVEGQIPFAGVGYAEMAWDNVIATQLQLQYRPTTNNYMQLKFAVGQDAPYLEDLLKHQSMLGGSFSYYYNTMFGPLGGSIGYSNLTKKFYYYINLGFFF